VLRAIAVAGVLLLAACQSPGSSAPGIQSSPSTSAGTSLPGVSASAPRASSAPVSIAPIVTAEPTASPTVQPTAAPTPVAANCAASYPDFCIPPPPPDLNCADVAPHKNFTVLWTVADPDPHHFDGNKDGVGCEG
jgi:hypothetical protein